MNVRDSQAPENAVRRYTTYGLFGGGAFGGVVGVLLSGPNFFVWSLAQSAGVITGLAVGVALVGYLFVGLLVGGLAAGGVSSEELGEIGGSLAGASAADGADGGGGGGGAGD